MLFSFAASCWTQIEVVATGNENGKMAAEIDGSAWLCLDLKSNCSSNGTFTWNGLSSLVSSWHCYFVDCIAGLCLGLQPANNLWKPVKIGCHNQSWNLAEILTKNGKMHFFEFPMSFGSFTDKITHQWYPGGMFHLIMEAREWWFLYLSGYLIFLLETPCCWHTRPKPCYRWAERYIFVPWVWYSVK